MKKMLLFMSNFPPPGGGSSEKYTPLYYVQKTNQNQYNVYPYLKPLDESMFGQVEVQD